MIDPDSTLPGASAPLRRSISPLSVALAMSIAALFAPLVFLLVTRRVIPMTDMRGFHIPLRFLFQEALRGGDSILWSPSIYSGAYIHGEGQLGELHPIHWLLYRFAPLDVGINAELLLTYALTLAGTFLFFRLALQVGGVAAALGATLFAFGGFNLLHLAHMNMIAVLSHLPWTLWLSDVIVRADATAGRRRIALASLGLAAVTASQWLLGFPQGVYLTWLAAGALVVVRVAGGSRAGNAVWCVAALVLGTGVGAVQILPTLDTAAHAYRYASGPSFALMYSLHPLNVVQLWSPWTWPSRVYTVDEPPILHEFTLYNGAICVVAIAWLAMRWRALEPSVRRVTWTVAACGALALVLALGRFGYLQTAIVHLPGFSIFRAPSRHIVLVHLALSAIAAVAFEDMTSHVRPFRAAPSIAPLPRGWMLVVPVLMTTASVAAINGVPSLAPSIDGVNTVRAAASAIVVMALMCALALIAARGRTWALPLLVVFSIADIAVWGYSFTLVDRPVTLDAVSTPALVPREARPLDYLWRPPQIFDGNLAVLRGVRLADGYLALSPRRVFDPARPAAQRLAGVTWSWDGARWGRVTDPMPRARLVAETLVTRGVRRYIETLDIATTAIVGDAVGELDGPPGTASVIVDRPGWIEVDVRAPERQLLVLTERFHEGWTAIRGCAGAPLAVYGEMLGCVVPPGASRVELRFAPRSFTRGAAVSLASCGVWVVAAAFALRRRAS